MKQLLIGLAVGILLACSSHARAELSCKTCQSNYTGCYESARSARLGCSGQCSTMLKFIRAARDVQGLMDAGQLVCSDGGAPVMEFQGQTLEATQAGYAECKSGCNAGFSEGRAGCREQRTVCLASCKH